MEQKGNQISNRLHYHQERRRTTGKGQHSRRGRFYENTRDQQIRPQHIMPHPKNTTHK